MGVRDPRRPPRNNYTGMVPMIRIGSRPVSFESMIEMDWLVVTDAFDFDVVDVRHQPCEIEYFFDGKHRTWTPDFQVVRKRTSRKELVEVKTLKYVHPGDGYKGAWRRAKLRAQARAAGRNHFDFRLCTDAEIRVQPRLKNALLVGAAAKHWSREMFQFAIESVLRLPHATSVPDLQRLVGPGHDAFNLALHLAWKGLIRLDPSVVWSRETAFERTDRSIFG